MQPSNTGARLGSPVNVNTCRLVVRYANGSGTARPSTLTVIAVTASTIGAMPSRRKSYSDCPGAGTKLGSGHGKSSSAPPGLTRIGSCAGIEQRREIVATPPGSATLARKNTSPCCPTSHSAPVRSNIGLWSAGCASIQRHHRWDHCTRSWPSGSAPGGNATGRASCSDCTAVATAGGGSVASAAHEAAATASEEASKETSKDASLVMTDIVGARRAPVEIQFPDRG